MHKLSRHDQTDFSKNFSRNRHFITRRQPYEIQVLWLAGDNLRRYFMSRMTHLIQTRFSSFNLRSVAINGTRFVTFV